MINQLKLIASISVFFLLCGKTFAVSYTVNFNGNELSNQQVRYQQNYDRLTLPGLQFTEMPGMPDLPVKYITLLLPAGNKAINVSVSASGANLSTQYNIAPAQEPVPLLIGYKPPTPALPNQVVYSANALYPQIPANIVSQTAYSTGNNVVTIAYYPLQYNPVTQTVKFNNSVTVTVQTAIDQELVSLIRTKVLKKDWLDEIEALTASVANPLEATSMITTPTNLVDHFDIDDYNYLVLVPDQYLNHADWQKFKQWKNSKGNYTKIMSYQQAIAQATGGDGTINDDAAKVKNFLKQRHIKGLTYVLLVGDGKNSPLRYGFGSNKYESFKPDSVYKADKIPADNYFADLLGNWNRDNDRFYGEFRYVDDYGNIYGDDCNISFLLHTGRLPIPKDYPQGITNWIEKVLTYEQNPGNGDTGYLQNAFTAQADSVYDSYLGDDYGDILTTQGFNWQIKSDDNNGVAGNISGGAEVVDNFKNKGLTFFECHGLPNMAAVSTHNGYGYNPSTQGIVQWPNGPSINWYGTSLDSNPPHVVPPVPNYSGGAVQTGSDEHVLAFFKNEGEGNSIKSLNTAPYYQINMSSSCHIADYDENCWESYPNLKPSECLAYGFVAKYQSNGGPVMMANTRQGLYSSSTLLTYNTIERLFGQSYNSISMALSYAKAESCHHLQHSTTIIGDPELQVWTKAAQKMTVKPTFIDGGVMLSIKNATGSLIDQPRVIFLNNGIPVKIGENFDQSSFIELPDSCYNQITVLHKDYLPSTLYLVNKATNWRGKKLLNGSVYLLKSLNIAAGSRIEFSKNSKIIAYPGSRLIFEGTDQSRDTLHSAGISEGAVIEMLEDSFLSANCLNLNIVGLDGYSNSYFAIKSIEASLDLNKLNLLSSSNGLNITGGDFTMANSTFTIADGNGISLLNCNKYSITNTQINSNDIYHRYGGISLYESNGSISGCSILGFADGIYCVSSSPILKKNNITNNSESGISVSGNGSRPDLSNPSPIATAGVYNNTIKNNSSEPRNGAQIRFLTGNLPLLKDGFNNITPKKFNNGGQIFNIPALRGTVVLDATNRAYNVRNNYWGSSTMNTADVFSLGGYIPDYTPFAVMAFPQIIEPVESAKAEKLLDDATILESFKQYSEAEAKYDSLFTSYPESQSAYTGLIKLQDNYVAANKDVASLESKYQLFLDNANWNDKAFIRKQILKINLTSKQYAKVSALSDEIIAESTENTEIIGAKIDKIIANGLADYKNRLGINLTAEIDQLIGELFAPVSITEQTNIPANNYLAQNYPNPFNNTTMLNFGLAKSGEIKVNLYNCKGELVKTVLSGTYQAGKHKLNLNFNGYAAGIYFCRLETPNSSDMIKLMLLK